MRLCCIRAGNSISLDAGLQAIAYLRMRVFGAPAQLLMYVATGIFRGCRDTRTGARAAVVGFVVNLSLDLTLILGLHAGVAGAAAATSISQCAPLSPSRSLPPTSLSLSPPPPAGVPMYLLLVLLFQCYPYCYSYC